MSLPDCVARRPWDVAAGQYCCVHPNVHAAGQIVGAAICASCPWPVRPEPKAFRPYPPGSGDRRDGLCFHLGEQTGWRECPTCNGNVRLRVFDCRHPRHGAATLADCRTCGDFVPDLSKSPTWNWSVGIVAAPRPQPTLGRTLGSLALAGWRSPRIFAEEGLALPEESAGCEVTWRAQQVGAWGNFYLALAELAVRAPRADAYLMLQDDVVFCRNVRARLERDGWPSRSLGALSLYTSSLHRRRAPGFEAIEPGGGFHGALALAFPAAAARAMLADPIVVDFLFRSPPDVRGQVDFVVGRWATAARLPLYVHGPSLAQHIGDSSTLWPAAANEGKRRAEDFPGEEADALALPAAAVLQIATIASGPQ